MGSRPLEVKRNVNGTKIAGIVLCTPTFNTSPVFRPGDNVFGVAQGAFATYAICLEESLQPISKLWSFEAAAGLPATTPTAYAALITRATLKRGGNVPIHAAAGASGWLPSKSQRQLVPM